MYLKDPLGRVASTAVFKQRQFNSGLFGLADTYCSKVPVNASLSRRQSSARTAYHCADIETEYGLLSTYSAAVTELATPA
jgi:hypothetical protein